MHEIMQLMTEHPYLVRFVGAFLAYLILLGFYRILLHPLAHIPGPVLPKLSTWYECYYDLWLAGRYPWQLKAMHEKYGPIVRPVPDEVHIDDPDFLEFIYATRNRNQPYSGGLLVDESIGAAEEFSLHKLRRDALNPYFSLKAIMNLEHLFAAKRDKLVARFDEALQSNEPLNISDVLFAFSNDVVRLYCFGSDNALLDNLAKAKEQRENLARLLTGVPVNTHFPWIARGLSQILPLLLGDKAIPASIKELLKFRAKAGKDIEAIFADKTNDRKGVNSVFYELRDSTVLPPEEKTVKRLQDEATLLIMAGTESPAKSMGIAALYLISQPEIMSRLRRELSNAPHQSTTGELSLKKLMSLPYVIAIIDEANRLSFGVTKRLVRFSPTETLLYTASYGPQKGTEYTLPPGTRMSTVTYCTHTNEELFPDPWTFDPERWLTKAESDKGSTVDEVNRRKRCMMALGKGHRVCLGRHVANAEMSLFLEALSRYEMTLFETDENDVKFQHDYQISHPRLNSLGVRVQVEGKCTM